MHLRRRLFYLGLGFILGTTFTVFTGKFLFHKYFKPERVKERFIENLTHKLDLNDKQAAQVRVILEEKVEKYKSIHRSVRPRFLALRDESVGEINALLTEAQKPKFQALMDLFNEKLERFHKGMNNFFDE